MTTPTVAVTIVSDAFTGAPVAGGSAILQLTDMDIVAGSNGATVTTAPQTFPLDANGQAVVQLFPNQLPTTGLGTRGTQYKVTILNAAGVQVGQGFAQIPNAACNLHDYLVNIANPTGLTDGVAAVNLARSYRDQAAASQSSVAFLYHGTYAVAPTTRPPEGTGAAIQNGDRANFTDGYEYHYTGSAWVSDAKNAAASASAASTSQGAAATSATNAATSLADLMNRYQGAFASDPTLRPDGTALHVGDSYFNSTANLFKVWNGATFQASDINTANLAASGGAALVGFQQAGTGAVARTVQDKERDVVSVFDFMTSAQIADVRAGTASVDVTSPLNTAISAAQVLGAELLLPPGTYKTTSTLLITKNIRVRGAGIGVTTIKLVSATQTQAVTVQTTVALANAITGGGLSNFSVDCGGTCDGILVTAAYPYSITRAVYENIEITNTMIGFKAISDTGNVFYANTIRNILVTTAIKTYGFYSSGGGYNTWEHLEATGVASTAYAFHLSEQASRIEDLTSDGPSVIDNPNGNVDGFVIETIAATTAVTTVAVKFNRAIKVSNVFLSDVDNAKCPYAISVGTTNIWLDAVSILNGSTTAPQYQFNADAGATGVVSNFAASGGYLAEVVDSTIGSRFAFINCPTLTQYKSQAATNGKQTAVANNTATTMFALPSITQGTWIVTAGAIGPGASAYSSTYLIVSQSGTTQVTALHQGTYTTVTMSGLNVQVTQTTGAAQDIVWSCAAMF